MINHKGVAYSWQQVYKISGLCSEEQIQSKLGSYEDKVINLWEIFCD